MIRKWKLNLSGARMTWNQMVYWRIQKHQSLIVDTFMLALQNQEQINSWGHHVQMSDLLEARLLCDVHIR